MILILAFAFLSGLVTVLSPCVLPLLPVILSGGLGKGRARPLGIVTGFVLGFGFFTLALSSLVRALGIPPDALRSAAIAVIGILGLVMLVPALGAALERVVSRIASPLASSRRPAGGEGFLAGIPVGLSLGLVWTPCVGPVMASVISLALSSRVDGGAVAIVLAYGLGTGIPMLAVMLGGRALLARHPALSRAAPRVARGFGFLLVALAFAMAFGLDRRLQAALLEAFPRWGSGLTAFEDTPALRRALSARDASLRGASGAAESPSSFAGVEESSRDGRLSDHGPAPALVAAGPWLGGGPLSMEGLRGKVVLVDFWTYSCVNCVRVVPRLRGWRESYAAHGLEIIGVHSPEFAFEREPRNVERAMAELGVTWPVVLDNDFEQWEAYRNRYWPASYLVDARGRVRYVHYGEGAYAETEAAIRALLAEAGADLPAAGSGAAAVLGGPAEEGTPSGPAETTAETTAETYLGYGRAVGFVSAVEPEADRAVSYRPSRSPGPGEWSLGGTWTIASEYSESSGRAFIELGFEAREVYLVASPAAPGVSARVLLDGAPARGARDAPDGRLTPSADGLYHIVSLPSSGRHVLRIELEGSLRLYAFTFG